MNPRPSGFQKLLHRFFMLRPVTAFFAPWVHRLDNTILNLSHGKYNACGILGWNIIQLTTTGAKTAQSRTVPLMALFDGEKIALIASSYGRKRNPAWYHNLKAQPECQVQWRGKIRGFAGYETNGGEYVRYWQLAVSYYAGYEKYKERAAHRHIPIIVLEPTQSQWYEACI